MQSNPFLADTSGDANDWEASGNVIAIRRVLLLANPFSGTKCLLIVDFNRFASFCFSPAGAVPFHVRS